MHSRRSGLVLLTASLSVISVDTRADDVSWDPWKWVQREYREFRMYPRLDRAYMFMADGAYYDARQYILEVQAIDPDDARVQELLSSYCNSVSDSELCASQSTQLSDSTSQHQSVRDSDDRRSDQSLITSEGESTGALGAVIPPTQNSPEVNNLRQDNAAPKESGSETADTNFERRVVVNVRPKSSLSEAQLMLGQAERSLGSGDAGRAHRVFNQIDISEFDRGTRARYWYSRGLAASELSLWNEATFCYQRATSLDENSMYLAQLAYSLEFEGRYDDAILAFEELVDLEPDEQSYRLSLAYLYYRQGLYSEAESTMRHLASQSPNEARYLEGQAFSAEHQFNWESAESAYSQLILLDDEQYSETKKVAAKRRLKTLENDWSFQLTDLVRLDDSPRFDDGSPIPFATYSGYFSLGAGYRIYHRGGEVKVIGRLYGSNQGREFLPENETVQATLGLTYKPFYSQNLIFSTERIFALNQYEDDWLVRASYSLDHNTFWQSSDAADHWYYSVYADVARYLESRQDYLTLNTRVGRRFYFENTPWAWQPYVIGGWANNNDETRADVGVGIGLIGFNVHSDRYWKRLSHQLSLEGRYVVDGNTPEEYTVRLLYELAY